MTSVAEQASALDQVFGRMLDTDSHEWIPASHWESEFGPTTALLAAMIEQIPLSGHHGEFTKKIDDTTEINPETIWRLKGSSAPGAIDMGRRLGALDAMGVDKELIFSSSIGVFGSIFATVPMNRIVSKVPIFVSPGLKMLADQLAASDQAVVIGRALMTAHNDWCIRVSKVDGRLRPVANLAPTSIDETMVEAQRLIDGGVRAIMIPSDCPPGGKSPAHRDLDAFWGLFERANVPILLHISGEYNFLTSEAWGQDVAPFEPAFGDLTETPMDPYSFSTAHFGAQNFLTTMVLGGVFERHPGLRVGVIELTSHWVGPMAENLTMWVEQFPRRMVSVLSDRPSEYLQRNVRVSSFHWEPVGKYIDRFGLDNVYTFASDYPHYEGGENSPQLFVDRLKRLGPEAVEKFFVKNGELLLPE